MVNLINRKRGKENRNTRDTRRDDDVSEAEMSDDNSIEREIESTREMTTLKRENRDMKNKVKELESELQKMKDQSEADRQEIIRKSHEYFDCPPEMSKKVEEFGKKTLFRHVKWITSDEILNDLQKKTSLANVTMDNFNVRANCRISWWRTCSIMVSDAITTQRNQVIMSIKAQVLKLKEREATLRRQGNEVPNHMKLPELRDILKMRQYTKTIPEGRDDNDNENDEGRDSDEDIENEEEGTESNDDNENEEEGTESNDNNENDEEVPQGNGEEEGNEDTTAFTFVVEHLVPAIVGRRTWKRNMCSELVSTTFTPSDEAFLYVILSNSYSLWKNTDGSRMGAGQLTRDGTNKKYCGWTKEGINFYNDMLKRVKENRQGQGAQDVEKKARKELQERYKGRHTTIAEAANRRRRKKRRKKKGDPFNSDASENEGEGENIDAENDLDIVFAQV